MRDPLAVSLPLAACLGLGVGMLIRTVSPAPAIAIVLVVTAIAIPVVLAVNRSASQRGIPHRFGGGRRRLRRRSLRQP